MRCPCSRNAIPGRKEPPVPRSGHSPQVAGALIPDNTQHSWQDDVGRGLESER